MDILNKLAQFIPNFSKGAKEEYYFALNIDDKNLEASLWGIKGHRIAIVSSAKGKYHDEESLLEQGNIALDEALADFPIEPEKILFGVPDSWLQDEDLNPEHLRILRRMVKEWGLAPLAYVSTSQAITHFLQKQQGVPLTGILVKVSGEVQVAVVKAGKVIATGQHKRTEHLAKDVERILLSFNEIEVLPSKILVFGDENFSKIKDDMQGFAWMSNLPFLHLPKIEELPKNITLASVCLAGAAEINPDAQFHQSDLSHLAAVLPPVEPKLSKHILEEEHEADSHRVGRHREEDFVKGDVKEMESEELAEEMVEMEKEVWGDDEGKAMVKHEGARHPAAHHKETGIIPSLLGLLPFGGPGNGVSAGGIMGRLMANKLLLLSLLVLIIFIITWMFLPKAKVIVFIDMKSMDNEAQVVADPNVTEVDEMAKKIPGEFVETDVSGSQKGSATGTKKVGESAKGSVLIYNKTSSPKTFSAGTSLVGPNNLSFTLDSSVSVASQSAVDGGISFGKASANATAADIGPDGNLAAGTELLVKNESANSYSAKVDQAFAGGVSKDVTVVTTDDQKRLLASLTSDLRTKAQDQIQGKLTGDMKILTQALTEQITKQAFSKKVGDQANDFNLEMVVRYKGTAYKDSDLKTIVSKLVSVNVPEGYSLDLSQTETQADVSKVEKDGRIVFTAKFKAKLMPKLDLEALKKDLVLKSPEAVDRRVKQIENVISSKVDIKPFALPGPFNRLPVLPQNISIEVTAK